MFLGPKRTYDDFKRQLKPELIPTFDSLRQFCLTLGQNVVEDVRAHRVVFGKSLSFRWFADLEPDNNAIFIKIQKDRKEPFKTITVPQDEILDEVKAQIMDAYNSIH